MHEAVAKVCRVHDHRLIYKLHRRGAAVKHTTWQKLDLMTKTGLFRLSAEVVLAHLTLQLGRTDVPDELLSLTSPLPLLLLLALGWLHTIL